MSVVRIGGGGRGYSECLRSCSVVGCTPLVMRQHAAKKGSKVLESALKVVLSF